MIKCGVKNRFSKRFAGFCLTFSSETDLPFNFPRVSLNPLSAKLLNAPSALFNSPNLLLKSPFSRSFLAFISPAQAGCWHFFKQA